MKNIKKKITLGILTYNQEEYIEECILHALALTYNNLEIVISDDCSSDKTFDIIKELVKENPRQHKIIIHKNESNLGIAGNFNKIFYELATGDFLVNLGGDDYISDNYFEDALSYFESDESLMMIDFNATILEQGVFRSPKRLNFQTELYSIKEYLNNKPINLFAPGRVFRNKLIKDFEQISLKCPTEDTVLINRALLLGRLMRVDRKVLYYRRHDENISSKKYLKTMSNTSIISQYIKDSLNIYEKGLIKDDQLVDLLERYRYELKKREVKYSYVNRYIRYILLKILKIMYFIRLKINQIILKIKCKYA